jgi:hypothetical protein
MAWQYQSGDYNGVGGAIYFDPDTQKFKINAPPHSLIIGHSGGAVDTPIYNDQSYTIKQWKADPYGRSGFGQDVNVTMQPGEMYSTPRQRIQSQLKQQSQKMWSPASDQFKAKPPLDFSMASWMS